MFGIDSGQILFVKCRVAGDPSTNSWDRRFMHLVYVQLGSPSRGFQFIVIVVLDVVRLVEQ